MVDNKELEAARYFEVVVGKYNLVDKKDKTEYRVLSLKLPMQELAELLGSRGADYAYTELGEQIKQEFIKAMRTKEREEKGRR